MSAICSGTLLSRPPAFDTGPSHEGAAASATARRTLRRFDRVAGRRLPHVCRYLPQPADAPLKAPRLIGVGRVDVQPGEAYPRRDLPKLYSYEWRAGRTLPEHQVVLLSNASGEFESEALGRVTLLGDALLFLFPGEWHRYRPLAGGGWSERWVALQGDLVGARLKQAGLAPHNAVALPDRPGRLRDALDLLIDAVESRPTGGGPLTPLAFRVLDESVRQATRLPIRAEEPVGNDESEVEDEIVQRALEIIWNHQHCPPLNVSDVARQLPVTRRTLDRRFADALGRTVLDEITACRISRAKRLLANTDMPIKAVAYRSGFPSRERLRLAFLSHEGMPPSEYRDSVRRHGAERE
ncbi:AraC family transcriptional regulator [Botrimarina sp.]|uniref:helix-turn-helix transcriptional regulator n=1 Tax=Botrimarina sp. TaxID=2795802 RepID=UPI0032EB0608